MGGGRRAREARSRPLPSPLSRAATVEGMSLGELRVLGACPLDCPDGCSWVVTVDDGKAVKLRGNPEHPFTRGALCAKVNGYLEHTQAPDRLLYPLRRVGRKGEGRFERISLGRGARRDRRHGCSDDHATSTAARRSGRSRAPARSATSRGWRAAPGRRLWNVLGASRHEMTICSVAGASGLTYTTGTAGGMDPETFAAVEADPAVGHEHADQRPPPVEVHPGRPQATARTSWRSTRCAPAPPTQADEHLAPLPGTDAALALGLLQRGRSTMGAEDQRLPRRRTRRLGGRSASAILEFPPDRVGGDHRAARGADRRARRAARDHAADRRSAPRWACSATPAAAWRCARSPRCPA